MSYKILILRFSSFGDIVQSLSIPSVLHKNWPQSQIHWVTRSDFSQLIERHPSVEKVWTLDKKQGWKELWRLFLALKKENFTHIYDAHNSLRSNLLGRALVLTHWSSAKWLQRSIRRWKRFLLFQFRYNLFEQPFSGQRDLLEPLKKWGLKTEIPSPIQLYLPCETQDKTEIILRQKRVPNNFVALAPSAAFPLKRWPLSYWKNLISQWTEAYFVILGGPEDSFLQELVLVDPLRVFNFAGQLSLAESAAVIELSQGLVSNDTGLLHVAEQLGKPTVALMGPAPFGFPSRPSTTILERNLSCRPCSKHGQGPCRNKVYQACLTEILPEEVLQATQKWKQQ